ncbi:MAG: phosphatidylserine decarboxylase family protein [Flavobacteriales bacterium]|nr:phosphatidylserine decarboxylase family protein [Flavobacteriales bacterium]
MKIHKEGYVSLIIAIVFGFTLSYLARRFFDNGMLVTAIYGFSTCCFLIVLQFFRSPKKNVELKENAIYAPADGKVVVIEEIEEATYFNEKRIQVSIFMSPVNVHVNWYPISGTIEEIKYLPGLHLVAWDPKSSTENEMTHLVIRHKNGVRLLVKQIAGALARRIVYYSKKDQEATQGEQLGFIKFGSRVDVLLPLSANINIKIGDKVTGCETVIAEFGS